MTISPFSPIRSAPTFATAPSTFSAAPTVRARSVAPVAGSRPADGLKAWSELSSGQQAMFGAGGAQTYAKLSSEQRAIFLVLSGQMERTGIDLSKLRLQDPVNNIRPNRILLSPDPAGMASLRADMKRGIESGRYESSKPFGLFHSGRADEGIRDNRDEFSMQIGMGKDGAFVDVDHYKPKGLGGWLKHIGEILVPGKPSAREAARAMGIDISTKIPLRRAA